MADILHTISIVSFVLAGLFVSLAITLWFVFKIHNIIGDLSGRNAKKSIALMRQNNEKSGDKSYKASAKNAERGKLTETMKGLKENEANEETGLLKENIVHSYETEATGLLVDVEATGLLNEVEETESLESSQILLNRPVSTVRIKLVDEKMLIHTEEVI